MSFDFFFFFSRNVEDGDGGGGRGRGSSDYCSSMCYQLCSVCVGFSACKDKIGAGAFHARRSLSLHLGNVIILRFNY